MKEWKQVRKQTYLSLLLALAVLILSFVIMTYGSMKGDENSNNIEAEAHSTI